MDGARSIVIVGAQPPPVTGQTMTSHSMIGWFRAAGYGVRVLSTTRGLTSCGLVNGLLKGARYIRAAVVLIYAASPRRRFAIVYFSVESSSGRYLSLLCALLVAVLSRSSQIVFHIHSRQLVERIPSGLRWVGQLSSSPVTVIVLCPCQAERVRAQFPNERLLVHCVSNAALLPGTRFDYLAASPEAERLSRRATNLSAASTQLAPSRSFARIGYYSRLTSEKGFDRFMRLAEGAENPARRWRFLAAGALQGSDLTPMVEYQGDLRGDARMRFLASLDLMLFPSRYAMESEPLAVLEALSVGTPVIASRLGCLASVLPQNWLVDLDADDQDWTERITAMLEGDPASLAAEARRRFASLAREGDLELRSAIRR
jgi:glycosyltransferase involved in cell wall biosynthesis